MTVNNANYETVVARLRNHAPLPAQKGNPDTDGLCYQFWLSEKNRTPPNLSLFDDVVSCLALLNRHFNGPDPDHRDPMSFRQPIPNDVAYLVGLIVERSIFHYRDWTAQGLFPPDILAAVLVGAHRILFAWNGILEGDISDLLESFI